MPEELKQRMRKVAQANGITLNAVANMGLLHGLPLLVKALPPQQPDEKKLEEVAS